MSTLIYFIDTLKLRLYFLDRIDACKSCVIPEDAPKLRKLLYDACLRVVNEDDQLRVDQLISAFKEIMVSRIKV